MSQTQLPKLNGAERWWYCIDARDRLMAAIYLDDLEDLAYLLQQVECLLAHHFADDRNPTFPELSHILDKLAFITCRLRALVNGAP
jgi:hypothetical protein